MLGLARNVHAACFGDRAVILDTRADRYRMLTGRKARVITALLAGDQMEEKAASALVADHILVANAARPMPTTLAVPARGALEEIPVQPPRLGWSELAVTAATIATRLRLMPLDQCLDWAVTGAEHAEVESDVRLVGYAHAFEQGRIHVPLPRNCLRDAALFTRLLIRRRIACRLVLGVRLDPFGAHSWVQSGDLVLTGKLGSARELKPILVL